MTIPQHVAALASIVGGYPEPVGSRITCNPPPTGTDADFLVHVSPNGRERLTRELLRQGYALGGSSIPDENANTSPDDRFESFTLGEVNLIVTSSKVFFRKFLAATWLSRRLNLMDKADRIALFQAVLYGNECP